MGRLAGRLQQLRELREQSAAGERPGTTGNAAPEKSHPPGQSKSREDCGFLRGWEQTDPHVWRRERSFPLQVEDCRLSGVLLGEMMDPGRLSFYDFETTGLSGGAGTIIFLAGFGSFQGDRLVIEQVLLGDYPGERYFLNRLLPFLGREKTYVSYNGKSFDRSILQNRLRMHGLREDMPRQLDLLYPSRRLWARVLDGCGLQQVERHVLGTIREGDIGGALIPQCYQDFIRGIGDGCMQGVAEHHLQDILSLAKLLLLLEALPEEREKLRRREEKTGLGVLLLAKNDLRAVDLFEEALAEGDETAGRYLTILYKRGRRYGDLERTLKGMLELRPGFFQITEMAKLLEHHHRQPRKALELLETTRAFRKSLTDRQYAEYLHRKRRLTRILDL